MISFTKYQPYKYRIAKITRLINADFGYEETKFFYVVQQRFLFFFWTAVSPIYENKEDAKQYYLLNFKK